MVEILGLGIGAEADRHGDMVGIFGDDLAQPPFLKELVLALFQMQRDIGAAHGLIGAGDGEFALAFRHPAPGLGLAGMAA